MLRTAQIPSYVNLLVSSHTIVYLAFGVVATHYIPILLILKLYNFKIDDDSKIEDEEKLYRSINEDKTLSVK